MPLVQVTGTQFVRDTETMALINRDSTGLEDYLTKRRMMENQRTEINNIKSEMNCIKSDMTEIKQLLQKLLES